MKHVLAVVQVVCQAGGPAVGHVATGQHLHNTDCSTVLRQSYQPSRFQCVFHSIERTVAKLGMASCGGVHAWLRRAIGRRLCSARTRPATTAFTASRWLGFGAILTRTCRLAAPPYRHSGAVSSLVVCPSQVRPNVCLRIIFLRVL